MSDFRPTFISGRARPAIAVAILITCLVAALTPSTPAGAANGSPPYSASDDRTPAAIEARQAVNGLHDVATMASATGHARWASSIDALASIVECLSFGCPAPKGDTTISMDTAGAGGFFSMPWPSDTRRRADGSIDLTGFPGAEASLLAQGSLQRGSAATNGFGTNSAIYFQSTAPIDPASLPAPDATEHQRSPVMLINLDDPSAPPEPLLVDTGEPGTTLRPANLLTLLPYPGHALRSATRYAAVVLDGVTDKTGRRLTPNPLIGRLNGPAPAGTDAGTWQHLRVDRDTVTDALRARSLWHASELVAFSVFTTQNTEQDLSGIADAVNALPQPAVVHRDPVAGSCASVGAARSSGQIDLPRWQQGTPPYLLAGGGIVLGPDGRAVQQGTERVRFDMTVPCTTAPPAGWPILLFMDGTGGSAASFPISQLQNNAMWPPAPLPFAVLSIAPVFSGDRAVSSPIDQELTFFNYFNPLAGRTNQLQQAADMVYLERIARGLTLDPTETPGPLHLDANTVVVAGHSQGALTLPLTIAADPTIRGAFISSGGAGLYHAIAHRGDIQRTLEALLPSQHGEFNAFHPYVQIMQTFAEIGDSANYAAYSGNTDVVVYAGLDDGCSPIEGSVHLAEAMGLQIGHPVTRPGVFGSVALEPSTTALPASRNLAHGRTGVLVEAVDGHFGATTNPRIGGSFVDSIANGGVTKIDPGTFPAGSTSWQCARADAAPGVR